MSYGVRVFERAVYVIGDNPRASLLSSMAAVAACIGGRYVYRQYCTRTASQDAVKVDVASASSALTSEKTKGCKYGQEEDQLERRHTWWSGVRYDVSVWSRGGHGTAGWAHRTLLVKDGDVFLDGSAVDTKHMRMVIVPRAWKASDPNCRFSYKVTWRAGMLSVSKSEPSTFCDS